MFFKVLNKIQAGELNLFKEIKMVYQETFPLVAPEECTNKTTSGRSIIDLLRDICGNVVTVSIFINSCNIVALSVHTDWFI